MNFQLIDITTQPIKLVYEESIMDKNQINDTPRRHTV